MKEGQGREGGCERENRQEGCEGGGEGDVMFAEPQRLSLYELFD